MKTDERTITISQTEYEKLKALESQNAELTAKVNWLMKQFKLGQHRRFGASSEKSEYDRQISLFSENESANLFNEAEATADDTVIEPELIEVTGHSRKRKNLVNNTLPEDIPVQTVICELPEEQRICPECGELMHPIGRAVIRSELVLIPAHAEIREYVQVAYGCRPCEQNANDMPVPIIKAPVAEPVIKGSFASPESIAHIMVQKFVMGAPLYRQEQGWKRQGIMLSRQTMSNWLIRATMDWLKPVYDELHKRLLAHTTLHADETTLQVLHGEGKTAQSKSYMWLYRTSGYDQNGEKTTMPIVLYEYQPNRKKEHPAKFLKGFKGYLHVDGYEGYHSLPEDIIIVGCMAHLRRKFDEAIKALPAKDRGGTDGAKAKIGKTYCDKLFSFERRFANMSPDKRYESRQKISKPIVEELYSWIDSTTVLPKTPIGAAFTYALGQRKYLENYLLDGRLEISNNRAERSIKPFVIDRKNFLFSNTPRGAEASAIMFSIIETAKENGLNPFSYLTYIFKNAPNWDSRNKPEMLTRLLPNAVPADCRVRMGK